MWCMVGGIATLSAGCQSLGAGRSGRRGWPLLLAMAVTVASILGGFGLALLLPATEGTGSRLVLGLPARAAAVLYVTGVLPLVVLPLLYALAFDRHTLTDEDLSRVRAARRDTTR